MDEGMEKRRGYVSFLLVLFRWLMTTIQHFFCGVNEKIIISFRVVVETAKNKLCCTVFGTVPRLTRIIRESYH